MEFNLGSTKQAAEVLFSCKKPSAHHQDLIFNGTVVTRNNVQKHLGLALAITGAARFNSFKTL